jgi:hypothetical protein
LLHDAIVARRLIWIGTPLVVLGSFVWLRVDMPVGFLGGALGLFGMFLLFKGRRYLSRFESAKCLQDDPRPPVVLLRPFQLDACAVRLKKGLKVEFFEGALDKTYEEYLAESVRPIGPLIALAEPGQGLPPAGAARLHETHQTWKDRVVDLLRGARLVILIPGTSVALLWEMWTAFQELRPQQLVILDVGKDTPREYKALSLMFKEATGQELPAGRTMGRAGRSIITFDEGWTPRILRPRGLRWRCLDLVSFLTGSRDGRLQAANLHYGLKPVFQANGIEWHPLPVSWEEVLRWGVFAAIIVFSSIWYSF